MLSMDDPYPGILRKMESMTTSARNIVASVLQNLQKVKFRTINKRKYIYIYISKCQCHHCENDCNIISMIQIQKITK